MKGIFQINQKRKLTIVKSKPKLVVSCSQPTESIKNLVVSTWQTPPKIQVNPSLEAKNSQSTKQSRNELRINSHYLNLPEKTKTLVRAHSTISTQDIENLNVTNVHQPQRQRRGTQLLDYKGSIECLMQNHSQFTHLVDQIINNLKAEFVLSQNHLNNFTVKKEQLHALLTFLISHLSFKGQRQVSDSSEKASQLCFLRPILNRINNFIQSAHKLRMQRRMFIQQTVFDEGYSQKTYALHLKAQSAKLTTILEEQADAAKKVSDFAILQLSIKKQIEENQLILRKQIEEKSNMEQNIRKMEEQTANLKVQITSHCKLLEQTKKTEQMITNFINEQNNKMIQMAGEEYKKIESDIYEYAVYLQSNQLASDISYEPQPFKHIEEDINQNLKQLSRIIIQDLGMDSQSKNKLMRDFMMNTMEKFKKKDCELQKLNDFKTKCIRTFVNHMKRWLDNWSLKQEYLVNLRNSFLIDNQSLLDKMQMIKASFPCEKCEASQAEKIDDILALYRKIEDNYKMGNSFY